MYFRQRSFFFFFFFFFTFPRKQNLKFHANCLHWFSQKTGFDISCKLSPAFGDNLHGKVKPVFRENKKTAINLSSAELAQRVVKVLSLLGRH